MGKKEAFPAPWEMGVNTPVEIALTCGLYLHSVFKMCTCSYFSFSTLSALSFPLGC
jgi:hypothetical protein